MHKNLAVEEIISTELISLYTIILSQEFEMPIAQLADSESTDDRSKTFVFQDEGHTLGNALRCIISSYPDVQFCGYTVPHPAESKMHFRIQMSKGHAVDALKRGLEDLVKICNHTLKVFDAEVTEYMTENNVVYT